METTRPMLLQRKRLGRSFLHMRVATITNWSAGKTDDVLNLIEKSSDSLRKKDKTGASPLELLLREMLQHDSSYEDLGDSSALMETFRVVLDHSGSKIRREALASVRNIPFLRAQRFHLLKQLVLRQDQLDLIDPSAETSSVVESTIALVLKDFADRQRLAINDDFEHLLNALVNDLRKNIRNDESSEESLYEDDAVLGASWVL